MAIKITLIDGTIIEPASKDLVEKFLKAGVIENIEGEEEDNTDALQESPTESLFFTSASGTPKLKPEFAAEKGKLPQALKNQQEYIMQQMPGEIETAKTITAYESQPELLKGIEKGLAPFSTAALERGEQPGFKESAGDLSLGLLTAMPSSRVATGSKLPSLITGEIARGAGAEGIASKVEDREFSPLNAVVAGAVGSAGEGAGVAASKGLKSAIGKVSPFITDLIETKGISDPNTLKKELKTYMSQLFDSNDIVINEVLKDELKAQTKKGVNSLVSNKKITRNRGDELNSAIDESINEILANTKKWTQTEARNISTMSVSPKVEKELLPLISRAMPRANLKLQGEPQSKRLLHKNMQELISKDIVLPKLNLMGVSVPSNVAGVGVPVGRYGAVYLPTLMGNTNK